MESALIENFKKIFKIRPKGEFFGGPLKLGNHAVVEKERKKRGRGAEGQRGREGGREGGGVLNEVEERRGIFPKGKNGRVTISTIYSQLPFKKIHLDLNYNDNYNSQ